MQSTSGHTYSRQVKYLLSDHDRKHGKQHYQERCPEYVISAYAAKVPL